jgi:hypothetical protein
LVNIPLTLLARARTAGLASDMTEAARRPGAGRRQPAGILGYGQQVVPLTGAATARNDRPRACGPGEGVIAAGDLSPGKARPCPQGDDHAHQADPAYSAQVTGCDDVRLDGVVCGVRWVASGHHTFEEVSAGQLGAVTAGAQDDGSFLLHG